MASQFSRFPEERLPLDRSDRPESGEEVGQEAKPNPMSRAHDPGESAKILR